MKDISKPPAGSRHSVTNCAFIFFVFFFLHPPKKDLQKETTTKNNQAFKALKQRTPIQGGPLPVINGFV